MSLRETGLILLNLARSTKAITAYLPLDVSFINPQFIWIYINLTNLVKYLSKKKAKEIKLTNIFDAVDEKVKTVQCKKDSKKGCNGKATKCVTHNLWDELENHINNFFNEKSLEDLVKDNHERRI